MVSEEETEISSLLWGELDSGPRSARRWGWVGRRRGSAADLVFTTHYLGDCGQSPLRLCLSGRQPTAGLP